MTYKDIFKVLEQGNTPNWTPRQQAVLLNANIVSHDFKLVRNRVKTGSQATPDTVQVSLWRNGTRKDSFTSGSFTVVKRTDKFITYKMATGKLHTIAVEYTRAA